MQSRSLLLAGGSGFLGTAISERLLTDDRYTRIVILSRDWHKQAVLREHLGNPSKFRWFIGDICDKDRLVLALNGIDDVIIAAALKDVVAGSYNAREVLYNNGVGTQNIIEAAIECHCQKVLFISSDKACQAENIYGAFKFAGEQLIVSANAYSPRGTKFASCRYGNVLGSSGSVLPLFRRQKISGTLTVTSDKMTRFWFRPIDAVEFVLKSIDEMVGGEVFVPKLSASLVIDLARAIAPDANIELIGIRPGGEKIHEAMVSETESFRTKDVSWCYRIEPTIKFWDTATSYPGGSPVPWGWVYSSASAPRLTVEQLQEMVK